MASKNRVPTKVKRAKAKGQQVSFDGKTWRVNGSKLDNWKRQRASVQ